MNNIVFGKMIENVRKRKTIKLIVSEEQRKKLALEPNYKACTTFSDELMAIEMRKTRIVMNKPIIVGQAILYKSKELMYSFYYEYLRPKFKDKMQLLCMDTDSFLLEIETDDFFEDTKCDLEDWFDTSNYDKNMLLPDEYRENADVNKKVIGKMKNKIGNGHMEEFIAFSPKVYASKQYIIDGSIKENRKARGTNKSVTKKTLSFDRYLDCLFNNEDVKCIQHRIKSTPVSVDTVEINKVALKNYDNKRLMSFSGITTFPYGFNVFKVCFEELQMKRLYASYVDSVQ